MVNIFIYRSVLMVKFAVDKSLFDVFGDAQINVMVLRDVDNNLSADAQAQVEKLLDESQDNAHKFLTNEVFRKNEVVDKWREIYRQFKKKKGARASIEALLKRVDQGKGIGSINPLVDLYNAASLNYGVPCGGEDLDTIDGDLHLGVAEGGEDFFPLGDDENEPALPGEVIYYDNQGAVCRCLNWRDGQRTMLTNDTKNAIMVMEAMDDDKKTAINDAMEALKNDLHEYLNVDGTIYHLDANNSSVEL